jgi:hypothetical protein
MKRRIINTTIPACWAGITEACSYSGLGRCSLYKIIATGQVESAKVLGRRLVNLKSLSKYLSKIAKEQAALKLDTASLELEVVA